MTAPAKPPAWGNADYVHWIEQYMSHSILYHWGPKLRKKCGDLSNNCGNQYHLGQTFLLVIWAQSDWSWWILAFLCVPEPTTPLPTVRPLCTPSQRLSFVSRAGGVVTGVKLGYLITHNSHHLLTLCTGPDSGSFPWIIAVNFHHSLLKRTQWFCTFHTWEV
jgi:hypothetical protein